MRGSKRVTERSYIVRYLRFIALATVGVVFVGAVSLSAAGVALSAMPEVVCDGLVLACKHVGHVISVAHSWLAGGLFG